MQGRCSPLILALALQVASEQIAAVYLARDVLQVAGHAVGHDHVCFGFELGQVVYDAAVKEGGFFDGGLENNHLNAFGFDAFHDSLDAAGAEVVTARFHDQAVYAHAPGVALQDVL